MRTVRNALIGLIVSGVLAGVIVSCGGGGGGYGSSGGSTTPMYSVGGTLSGATGTVVLKLNGGSDMTVSNGPFNFPSAVAYTSPYNVQVVDANDRCTVSPTGAGLMGTTNITNVAVTCAAQAAETVIRSARLDGAQANTMATGIGQGGVIVNPTTRAITGGITFSGLTGAPLGGGGGAHIHRANGSIAVGLTMASDNATGMVLNNIALSPADYAELLAGTLYFNDHTVANPGGEIRGQINVQGGVVASLAPLDNTQEVPASQSTATGNGTVIVDAAPHDAATQNHTVLITYIAHNVSNASAAHIHTSVKTTPPTCAGGSTCNGPVILGFPTLQTNVDGAGTNIAYPAAGSPMSAQNLTDFSANYLYFNVHSTNVLCPNPSPPPAPPLVACGGGEIRGNIAVQ